MSRYSVHSQVECSIDAGPVETPNFVSASGTLSPSLDEQSSRLPAISSTFVPFVRTSNVICDTRNRILAASSAGRRVKAVKALPWRKECGAANARAERFLWLRFSHHEPLTLHTHHASCISPLHRPPTFRQSVQRGSEEQTRLPSCRLSLLATLVTSTLRPITASTQTRPEYSSEKASEAQEVFSSTPGVELEDTDALLHERYYNDYPRADGESAICTA